MKPLRPLFVCAIVFGGLVKLFESYTMAVSTRSGFITLWQSNHAGAFLIADGIRICASLFLLLAGIDLVFAEKRGPRWATFLFCLLLALYGWGLAHFTEVYQWR
ncbi:MAG: hypothetical protein O3A92_16415 [Verrucomicrobia bacterium]|nr:hypothetical protein [Verrucomicrobiota bacterium]